MDDSNEASKISTDFSRPELNPFPITRFTNYGDSRSYYAYGNTTAEDFLENITTSVREPVVLSLGCGDIHSCLYTLWKYFSPEHKDQRFDGVHFVLNDWSAAVLARNILFLYLAMKMPEEESSIKPWIAAVWGVWYNHELDLKHAHVLQGALSNLLKFSASLDDWSQSLDNPLHKVVRFASATTLREIHSLWKMWCESDINVSSVDEMHSDRIQCLRDRYPGCTALQIAGSAMDSILSYTFRKYIPEKKRQAWLEEVESYTLNGNCFAESVLNSNPSPDPTSINITFYERPDGKYTLHPDSLPYTCYFHALEVSSTVASGTDSKEGTQKHILVDDAASEAYPLLANSVQQFSVWLISSAMVLKQCAVGESPEVSFSFECSDAVLFCQKLQQNPATQAHVGFETKFDAIYSSNLIDHLSPPNLILAAAPLLKEDGLLFTTSLHYGGRINTAEEFLSGCFGFPCKLLPIICGVQWITMEGEYADPNESMKSFTWKRVHMSPCSIRDLSTNTEILAALENAVFKMATTFFQNNSDDSKVLHATTAVCSETAIALLLRFASNLANDTDVSSYEFWAPLCTRLSQLKHLRPFWFQFQIHALLHGLHLHLTMNESVCPLCNDVPLSRFLCPFSVRFRMYQEMLTPSYLICLYQKGHISIGSLMSRQPWPSTVWQMVSGTEYSYLDQLSDLGKEVYLIDCFAGHEVKGKLQLDFFLPRSLAQSLLARDYCFVIVAYQLNGSIGNCYNEPWSSVEGKLADLCQSDVSYTFQHISTSSRSDLPTSSFGQIEHINQMEGTSSNNPLLACSFCQEPSTELKACTGCRKAHYCNKVCQSKHWSAEHKQHCRQHKDSDRSRSVAPTPQQPPTDARMCSGCNKASRTLRNCPCHLAAYCSVECQRNDWPRHKDKCTARPSRK